MLHHLRKSRLPFGKRQRPARADEDRQVRPGCKTGALTAAAYLEDTGRRAQAASTDRSLPCRHVQRRPGRTREAGPFAPYR